MRLYYYVTNVYGSRPVSIEFTVLTGDNYKSKIVQSEVQHSGKYNIQYFES